LTAAYQYFQIRISNSRRMIARTPERKVPGTLGTETHSVLWVIGEELPQLDIFDRPVMRRQF
jgi:hypothetical protein